MAEQSTLLIVKPDAVRRGLLGEIVRRVEAKGLRVAEIRSMRIDRPLAEEHYAEHHDEPLRRKAINGLNCAATSVPYSGCAFPTSRQGPVASPAPIRRDVGRTLRRARQRRHVELPQAVEETRIPRKFLEALEGNAPLDA